MRGNSGNTRRVTRDELIQLLDRLERASDAHDSLNFVADMRFKYDVPRGPNTPDKIGAINAAIDVLNRYAKKA